jgi:hypothetical protein
VCDGFQAVMGVQFLIDVVQYVSQGLQSYFQRACNFSRVLACRKSRRISFSCSERGVLGIGFNAPSCMFDS